MGMTGFRCTFRRIPLCFAAFIGLVITTGHAEMPKTARKSLEAILKNSVVTVSKPGFKAAGPPTGYLFDGSAALGGLSSILWTKSLWSLGGTSYVYTDGSLEGKSFGPTKFHRSEVLESVDTRMHLVESPASGLVSLNVGDPFRVAEVWIELGRQRHLITLGLWSKKRYEFTNLYGGKVSDERILAIGFHLNPDVRQAGDVQSILAVIQEYLTIERRK